MLQTLNPKEDEEISTTATGGSTSVFRDLTDQLEAVVSKLSSTIPMDTYVDAYDKIHNND